MNELKELAHVKRLALALAVSASLACSQGSPLTSSSSPPASAAVSTEQPQAASADDLLRARLREAALQREASHAMREPEPARIPEDFEPGVRIDTGGPPKGRAGEILRKLDQGEFRNCAGSREGSITLKVAVDADGKLTVKSVVGSLVDDSVKACIKKVAAAQTFGPGAPANDLTLKFIYLSGPSSVPSPEPSASASALASSQASEPPASVEEWPILVIEGKNVTMDGRIIADTTVIVSEANVKKVGGVSDALKAWKKAWTTKNPDRSFVGIAGLRVDPKTPASAVKSVFQTIANEGFEDILVQSAADPASIHELATEVAPPPEPGGGLLGEPLRALWVQLRGTEVVLLWKKGAETLSEEKTKPADLGGKVCDSWKKSGKHLDPGDAFADRLVVFLDNALAYSDLENALKAIESCSRPGVDNTKRPAFWSTLTMR